MSRVKSYQIELVETTNIKSFKTENNVQKERFLMLFEIPLWVKEYNIWYV